jgi:hypothetical protein
MQKNHRVRCIRGKSATDFLFAERTVFSAAEKSPSSTLFIFNLIFLAFFFSYFLLWHLKTIANVSAYVLNDTNARHSWVYMNPYV